MTKISDAQIAQYISNAGATPAQVPTMVAIALAESGGDTASKGDVSLETAEWGPSIGLWQIRSLNAQRGTGGVRDEIANLDPQTNANHAMSILGSQGLAAWTTYTSGAYRLFLGRGNSASSNVSPTTATPIANASTSSVSGLSALLTNLSDPGLWKRLALYLFGSTLILIGLIMLVYSTDAGKAVTQITSRVSKAVATEGASEVSGAVKKA